MGEHYDALETRAPNKRTEDIAAQLPAVIDKARNESGHYAQTLADIEPGAITDVDSLADLPLLRKSDLLDKQQADPPFGGLVTEPVASMARVFQSPGPIYEVQAHKADYARFGRALFAAGFRSGELVYNTFSYHFTPAGLALDSGARAIGCPVFPAGVGQTELQARAIADLKPACYVGTPSFLNIILEKAEEIGVQAGSIKKGLVTAEPLPPSLRDSFTKRGIDLLQCYGTAELGLVAYETQALEGQVVDEGVIVEIVRPGTGDPVPDGEVGEIVVTVMNPEYPLIRFATGDMSAVLEGNCPTGRTNRRIKGWMGRADQTTKVRGMFVHPEQISEVTKRHPEIVRSRLVVTNDNHRDAMILQCELSLQDESAVAGITETLRDVCKLRGDVDIVAEGALPNDGKVIDDQRDFE